MSQSRLDAQLIEAVRAGNLQQVEKILENDIARYFPSQEAINKALVSAVHRNHLDIAKQLLLHRADADQLIKPDLGISLLQYACRYSRADMVAALIPYVKNGDHISNEGRTALHYAIESDYGHLDIFEMLIDRGASHNHRKADAKGIVPSSQIGTILKLCRIDMARMLFEKRPDALAGFMLTQPNIISYICNVANFSLTNESIEAMLHFLMNEVPSIFIVNNKMIDEKYFEELSADLEKRNFGLGLINRCNNRILLSEFWLALIESPKELIKVKLHASLDTLLGKLDMRNMPKLYEMLANDIIMLLQDKPGVINKKRFMQVFQKLLAIFITAPDSKLCTKFANLLDGACQHLLQSDNQNETDLLCKLTLLTYLHATSCGNEDVNSRIVRLIKALVPDTSSFNEIHVGEKLLSQFIAAHHEHIAPFMMQLKQFYMTTFNIRLSPGQMSTFSKIESMLKNHELAKAQKAEEDAQANIATLTLQLNEARASLVQANTQFHALQAEHSQLVQQHSALESRQFVLQMQNTALLAMQDAISPEHSPVKQRKKQTVTGKQPRQHEGDEEKLALPLKFRFTLLEETKAAKESEKAAKASAPKKSRRKK